jgi:hypothetical protein
LLFYLYHVLAPRAANFRWDANMHRALHWRGSAAVGMPKPWELPMAVAGLLGGGKDQTGQSWTNYYMGEAIGSTVTDEEEWRRRNTPARAGGTGGTEINTSQLNSWFISRAYTYLGYSTTGLLSGGGRESTPCIRALWSFRRGVEEDPRFHRLPDPGLLSFTPYVPLW